MINNVYDFSCLTQEAEVFVVRPQRFSIRFSQIRCCKVKARNKGKQENGIYNLFT